MVENNQEIANEQSSAGQKQNVNLLNSSITILHSQLNYLALCRKYCEHFSIETNRACDCVNVRVSQLLNEIFPTNTQFYKQKNTKSGNKSSQKSGQNSSTLSVAGRRIDEVLHSLETENEKLRRQIELHERTLTSITKQILA